MLFRERLIWDTLCRKIEKNLMSTQNLADLSATAGSSEQRLPLPIDAPRISTISGGSLADAVQIVHEMHLTEKTGIPRKLPNSDLSKN